MNAGRKFITVILSIILSFLGGALCYHFGLRFLPDSDQANAWFEAQDMARGNFFLKGWVNSPDNFWLIDLLGMAGLLRLMPGSTAVLHILPAVWWGGIIGAACYLALGGGRNRSWRCLLPVMGFIALVPLYEQEAIAFITYAPYHVGTMFVALLGIIAAGRVLDGTGGKLAQASLFVFVSIIFISDPFAVCCFVMPACLVSLWRIWTDDHPERGVRCFVPVIMAFVVATVIKTVIHVDGGFHSLHVVAHFMALPELPSHLLLAFMSVLDLFGINFWGKTVIGHANHNSLTDIVRLVPFVFIALYVWRYVRQRVDDVRRNQCFAGEDSVSDMLVIGLVMDALAASILDFHIPGEDIIRYFLPVLLFATIAYARSDRAGDTSGIFLGAIVWSLLACVLTWHPRTEQDVDIDPYHVGHQLDVRPLMSVLHQQHLTYGYTDYWHASLTTLASGGELKLRSIMVNEDVSAADKAACHLASRPWLSKRDWYLPADLQGTERIFFLVYSPSFPKNDEYLKQAAVISNMGAPDRIVPVDDQFSLLIYDRQKVMSCHGLFEWEKKK